MKHGGDTLTYQHLYEGNIIDFSSNINPLGPPEGLIEEIMSTFDSLKTYPDIQYRHLKEEVSQYLGCQSNEVVLGNGAVDIIHNFCMMFDRVVVPYPCFSEYIERPKILGKQVETIKLNNDFEVNPEEILSHIHKGDLLILGNPNNPTGKRIDKQMLLKIHESIKEKEAFLLLDEVFWEFCEMDYDSIQLLRGSSNVCIVRAATKFFALPGIRLGYGYTSKETTHQYNKIALPWSINAFADTAGRIIFKRNQYVKRSRKYIAEQRKYMLFELKRIPDISVYDTHCNYILMKLTDTTEDEIFTYMIKLGIMVRKASSFEGLDNTFIRIAVKDKESNEYLIKCFRKYFGRMEI